MLEYKILKVRQPFIYSAEFDEYDKFQEKLLESLNSGYEISYSDNFTSETDCGNSKNSFKIFILRKSIK